MKWLIKHLLYYTAVLLSTVVSAQPEKKKAPLKPIIDSGRVFSIVIGVSKYKYLQPLRYAGRDAELFHQYLTSSQKSQGIADRNYLFLDSTATNESVATAFDEIDKRLRKGDRFYFYFSGHGDMEPSEGNKMGLLLLSQMDREGYMKRPNQRLDNSLFNEYIYKWTKDSIKIIFICDACHSADLIGGMAGRTTTVNNLRQNWENQVYLMSCQPNQLSLESNKYGGGRGLFSYYLINALQGLADKNKDSLISLLELDRFVTDSVYERSGDQQVPIFQGDRKTVLGKYDRNMIAFARKSIASGNGEFSYTFKGGGEEEILANLKDSVSAGIFSSFLTHLKEGELISPQKDCALSAYYVMPDDSSTRQAKRYMKFVLLDKLQAGFNEMIEYLYNDNFDKFDFIKRFQIQQNMTAAATLVGNNHYLSNRIKAQLLFLKATDLSMNIFPGVQINSRTRENLLMGIGYLKSAIQFDSTAPYLYLRLGDYYFYTNSYQFAIQAYLKYSHFLPNDSYAFNKLGLAYTEATDFVKADACFRRSVLLNPKNYKAQENYLQNKKRL